MSSFRAFLGFTRPVLVKTSLQTPVVTLSIHNLDIQIIVVHEGDTDNKYTEFSLILEQYWGLHGRFA